jgi:hypothetical protein
MPFILLLIGAIIAVTAFNNSQGDLVTELEADVPPFLKWGLAVFVVGGLGWIPGMAIISRWLLALVVMVLVLTNYQAIIAGFTALSGAGASTGGQAAANPTPAQAYIANPASPQVTQAQISGTAAGAQTANINANAQTAGAVAAVPSITAMDPAAFLGAFEAGFGGFGGIV